MGHIFGDKDLPLMGHIFVSYRTLFKNTLFKRPFKCKVFNEAVALRGYIYLVEIKTFY